MESTQVKNNVVLFCTRVQNMFQRYRTTKPKRTLEISAPFDLKLEPVSLPGVSQDELAILRDHAAASRVGTIETVPSSSSSMTSWESRHNISASRAAW
ncbi:hypothetical protein VHEMI03566 [[Torrubiella] hemipterigena]|uniref:Uncharacterized protein n=1 Tax=[Torrubiella] hemipterigena TaxID=1531966 RepID=A0A0A1SYV6_9HYPO|nr:hypothetical protein VHEMI03566 [[Torrubiella] hemipterigena]